MFAFKIAGLIIVAGSALFVLYVLGVWIVDRVHCRAARKRMATPPTLFLVPRDGTRADSRLPTRLHGALAQAQAALDRKATP